VDVANREQVERYADEVVKAHGGVHILINNAGVSVVETLEDLPTKISNGSWASISGGSSMAARRSSLT
jgi:NAD(P)-dependent dehydrogenase (short-subunit alcohol dehydrogenase family)